MTIEEKKKALYKEKPTAYYVGYGTASRIYMYEANLEDGTQIDFNIPESEYDLESFGKVEKAQLLIRWME